MVIELGFFFGGCLNKQNTGPTLRVCPPRGLCVLWGILQRQIKTGTKKFCVYFEKKFFKLSVE